MTKYKFGGALFAALTGSEFYSLFIQRLLRLVGREAISTLGPKIPAFFRFTRSKNEAKSLTNLKYEGLPNIEL